MQELLPLHITDNIEALDKIADKSFKESFRAEILEKVLTSLYRQLLVNKNDQETCYIHSRRLINGIEHLIKFSRDKKFTQLKYGSDLKKAKALIEELRPALIKRYRENAVKILQEKRDKAKKLLEISKETSPIFKEQFISCATLVKAIQKPEKMLLIDIRPEKEFAASKIEFENVINIPEDIINLGLSANDLGKKLDIKTQQLWEKRDTFNVLVLIDWNSDRETIYCSKLEPLKASIVEWDFRKYRQHPVFLNGGFKDFFETYSELVKNVHLTLPRRNEEVDELLELEHVTYPDRSIKTMKFKQFTITSLDEIEDDVQIEKGDKDKEIKEIENKDKLPGGSKRQLEDDDEENDDVEIIGKQIEAHRLKLLADARNSKPKIKAVGPDRGSGGDHPKTRSTIPPPIRRETKPGMLAFVGDGWCSLINIRNTCYMNTLLQCLKCIPIIKNVVVSGNAKTYTKNRIPVILNEFILTVRELWKGTENNPQVYKPVEFYEKICRIDKMYRKGNHEDCMEFFLFLFNHLNDDCGQTILRPKVFTEREKSWYGHLQGVNSLWSDLFYHQFECIKICKSCGSRATSYEMDNTLMLPVPNDPGLKYIHLNQLIEEYMDDCQILDYKCGKCRQMNVISRKSVVIGPEILVIVLKRYYQDKFFETKKNNVPVDFSLKMQFGDYNFKLYSIAEHVGTMTAGHYFAHGIINSQGKDVWVEFNDERLTRFNMNWDSVKESACAFFYSKVV